jgi:hypothetical protein
MSHAEVQQAQEDQRPQLRIVPGTENGEQQATPVTETSDSQDQASVDLTGLKASWARCAVLLNQIWEVPNKEKEGTHHTRWSDMECMRQSGIAEEGMKLLEQGVTREELLHIFRTKLCDSRNPLANLPHHMFDLMEKEMPKEESTDK